MKALIILAGLLLAACSSVDTHNLRQPAHTPATNWIVVGTAKVSIRNGTAIGTVTPINTNVTYTEPEKGKFSIETGTIVASETDEDNLSLGTLELKLISINKLKICGVGGNQKCTVAAIRVYTTGKPEAGFYHISELYGIPVTADGLLVGLEQANATIVNSYTIPANDRKLRNNDFSDLIYDLNVDISNATLGDYEMDIIVEIVVSI